MLTTANCLNCNSLFEVEKRETNRGNGKFCSLKCSAVYRASQKPKLEPNVKCAYCDKTFYKNESRKSNSKSKLYFCCRAHKDAAQCIGGIRGIMPPHYGETLNDYRDIVFKIHNKEKKCERCGYNQHPAAIIVHHKDRNRSNNDITNLEVLCGNCHLIEHIGDTLVRNGFDPLPIS